MPKLIALRDRPKPQFQSGHRSIRCHVDSDIDIRTESLLGREYTVVPVVAMVEGVRFGANQTVAELGLASEFGENPILWANRPLVLNHPQDAEGDYVSANSPEILESYAFGITMNPKVEDGKLKMEAWFDNTRISELAGEFQELFDLITNQDREDTEQKELTEAVEVSVGFFSDVEKKSGTFKGQKYGGIWRNIKPDHLAVLSIGTLGACSVADGCGVPRINADKDGSMTKKKIQTDHQCGCGTETCTCDDHNHETQTQEQTTQGKKPTTSSTSVPTVKPNSQPDDNETVAEANARRRAHNAALLSQTVNTDLLNNDVQNLLTQAAKKKFQKYTYLYGYNNDIAVFELWNEKTGGYRMFKIGINVEGSQVEFVGDPVEVVLQTKIVDAPTISDIGEVINANMENDMSQEDKSKTTPEPKAQEQQEQTTEQPKVETQQTEKPKVLTAQEYVDQAPSEIRDMLQAGLRAQKERRDGAIAAIKGNKANKFSDEKLAAMSLDELENIVAFAAPNYQGVAPAAQTQVQSGGNGGTVPLQRVFTPKSEQTKAA